MNFILSAELGFDRDPIIVLPDVYESVNQAALKQRLLRHPDIVNVAATSGVISGNNWRGKMLTRYSKNEVPVTMCNIDTAYFQTLGIKKKQWQNISLTDSVSGIVINEAAAKQLGLSSPMGEEIFWPRDVRPLKIVGVVEDQPVPGLQNLGATAGSQGAPGRPGGVGGIDGATGFSRTTEWHFSDLLAARRVDHGEG